MFTLDCLGGNREGETPGSIPNPEAKPLIADNTCPFRIGNVGRRLVNQFLILFNSFLLIQLTFIIKLFLINHYIFNFKETHARI